MNNWADKRKQMFNLGSEVTKKFLSMQEQVKRLVKENKELKAQLLELKKKHQRKANVKSEISVSK